VFPDVTRAERPLRSGGSVESLQDMLDEGPLSIPTLDLIHRLPWGVLIFDAGGAVLSANQAAEKLIGHAFDQRMTRADLIHKLGPGCAVLTDLAPGQHQVVHAGGQLLEVSAQQLGNSALLWLVVDKSEELRLRAQLAEHASLLAHSSEAFLVIGSDGRVRYANPVAEHMLRAAAGALVGLTLADQQRPAQEDFAISDDPADQVRAKIAFALGGDGAVRYNAWTHRADGTEFPSEITLRPYRLSQDLVLLTAIRDESRRLQHLQDLMEAKALAEAANRSKSAFMAITSHELRTPLASVIGFCDLLLLDHGDAGGDLGHYLRLIKESSRSLLNIINDILDLSKIEAKTLEVKVEPLDPDYLLDLLAELWTARAKAKKIELKRLPSVGKPGSFYSDPLRLRQVLDNLLSNALKFTDSGSIELHLEHHQDDIEITVRDSGCGLPPESQNQLFRPFWQIADHHTRREGGTGLGLYICRQITNLLGGTIWLADSSENGTAFKVRLPRNIEGQTGLHRVISESIFKSTRP